MLCAEESDVNRFYDLSPNIIGKGAFGIVVEGSKREGAQEKVAIKIIKLENRPLSQIASIRGEIDALRSLNHPNIVKLHDYYETPAGFHICMEIVKGGELFDRISQKIFYCEKDARDLVATLISVVKHCHDNNIVHRDIKAENLLMVSDDDDADVKLVDFGFAVKVDGNSLEGVLGTPEYMAPEIWTTKSKYGAPVDMWALGVLSYIILVGYPPFFDNAPLRLKTKIMRGIYEFHPEYWDKVSDEAKDFVSRLLTVDMDARMTAEQAESHPWLGVHEDELKSRELVESISQLKRFNAKRRLKASCNAVLAIGKMSRMMTLFRSKSGSTSSATSSISFSTEDCVDEIKLDDTCTTPSSPAASEEEINITIPRRHSFTPVAGMESLSAVVLDELQQSVHPHDNDDDLFREVHLKILDLEKENESILQSMIKADEDYEGGETCNNSTDGATSTGSIRQESTRDLFRLKFESNSSTIKSLQLNLPHPH